MESQIKNGVDVSIVIPAYNEEDAIATQIKSIQTVMNKTAWRYEIVVVNDGSTDGTAERANIPDVKLLSFPVNRGYGASLKTGITTARSELIVIIDADGTYPSEAIPEMLARSDKYDMVVGSRVGENVNIPFNRKQAKWFLRLLASYLSDKHIPDLNSGLRVFKKSIVEQFYNILPSGFSFTTTITLAFLCNEFLVYYHPINYFKRVGSSKIHPTHAYNFLLLILLTIVYFNPLKNFFTFRWSTFWGRYWKTYI